MTPQEYCQAKAGASGSSFYYSFLFLEPAKRQAITALYAFCREVDDVVDECSDAHIATVKLAWWRQEINNLYQEQPNHPVTQALLPAIKTYRLPRNHFLEIIQGMEMDLTTSRYGNFEELSVYCYHVASVVGLLSTAIFGYNEPTTLEFAKDLGMAFQLTNIIRDVGEDARRNRIYLPLDDLQRFHVSINDILQGRESANLVALLAFQSERALSYYHKAMQQLADNDRFQQVPSLIMGQIYLTVLQEIGRAGYPVLKQKISLTPVRKLLLAWRTFRKEKRLSKQHRRRLARIH